MPNERSIRLFGRVVARSGNKQISDFSTVHARNLLVYLAMHPDVDHPRDRLIQALWPDKVDGSARNRLSVTLYHAKRALTGVDQDFDRAFETGRSTVRFDSSVVTVDLHAFRKCIAAARNAQDADEKREQYTKAMGLYIGPLLPDILAEWALPRQLETSLMFQEGAVWLASDLDSAGRNDLAQELLSRALDTEPYSERATELLTSWFVRSGRYEEAVACAKRLRRALASHGQLPSRAMLERIDELNLVLADRTRAIVFADEVVYTVLAVEGVAQDIFEDVVQEHGGQVSHDGRYGLFTNPLVAMEAGTSAVAHAPNARALIHTTIMGASDPVPAAVADGLAVMERRGLYGSEAFVCLVRERNAAAVRRVSGAGKVWAVL